MCNCDDNINSEEVFSGPQGPQGPPGDTPIISGTSVSNLSIGTGSTTFTTQAGISWTLGQRIRAASDDGLKVMEGPITSYTSTTLVLGVDYTLGSGSHADWNLSICGVRGSTGATGANGTIGATGNTGIDSFSEIMASISLGSNLYQLDLAPTNTWIGVGQILFIENAGYYQVTSLIGAGTVVVLDLLYTGNTPTFALNSKVSPGGVRGKNGFVYETLDGNGTPAQGNGAYSLLIRNSTDTGYTFITASDLKTYLASLPAIGAW